MTTYEAFLERTLMNNDLRVFKRDVFVHDHIS